MKKNRIGVCSWSLRPENPDSLIDRYRAIGHPRLEGVQLALSPLIEQPGIWSGAVEKLREGDIEILSGMMAMHGEDYSSLESIARTGGVRGDATWEANREHARLVAKLAAASGLGLVTFHAGFIPEEADDPERGKLIARLREVADTFAEHGVELGFETGQETARTLLDALAELDHPSVGVNFDPANMILYDKGDPVEALRELARHVIQIHIKDALPTDVPGTWGTEVAVGDGAVDWPAFFEIAKAIEPTVDFIIEREAGEQRVEDVRKGCESIGKYMKGS